MKLPRLSLKTLEQNTRVFGAANGEPQMGEGILYWKLTHSCATIVQRLSADALNTI